MEEKNKVEKLFTDVKEYAETKLDLVALNVQEKGSDVMGSAASILVIGIVILFVLLFLSLGAAFIIGHCFHNFSIGFFLIAGFYFLVGLVIYFSRNKLIKMPVINALLKKINFHEED
ncbi:MAG: hypothetical protein JWP12_3556 [Bacteroidetes bacterium]|nr:hypothetical protein [Bacteroidota bacterium]